MEGASDEFNCDEYKIEINEDCPKQIKEENSENLVQTNIKVEPHENIDLEIIKDEQQLIAEQNLNREIKTEPPEVIEIIEDKRKFKCNTCSRTFTCLYRLKRHEIIHTNAKPGVKPFQCNLCSKTFSRLINLKYHERIHTGERPFKCTKCFKTFIRLTHLKQHERIHTGEKPFKYFKCKTCEKTFEFRFSLIAHIRTHKIEQSYKCKICFKTFTKSYRYQRHQQRHSIKKFKCNKCSATFINTYYLKIHEKIHIDEHLLPCNVYSDVKTSHSENCTTRKEFTCDICLQTFTCLNNFYKHGESHIIDKSRDQCLIS